MTTEHMDDTVREVTRLAAVAPRRGNAMTKEGWRSYVQATVVKPPPLTRARYEALPSLERARWNAKRLGYIHSFTDLPTPSLERVHGALTACAASLSGSGSTARPGVVITGEAFLGKTTATMSWARRFELAIRDAKGLQLPEDPDEPPPRIPAPELDGSAEYLPVAYFATPDSVGGMTRNGIEFYEPDLPQSHLRYIDRNISTLARYINSSQTSVVLIDQLHKISHPRRGPGEVSEAIKSLSDRCPNSIFVLTGIGIEALAIFNDGYNDTDRRLGQTGGRFSMHQMEPYQTYDAEGRADWNQFLTMAFSQLLLIDAEPRDHRALSHYILKRTNGITGAVMQLLRNGAELAIRSGEEKLTRPVLDQVDLSYFAEIYAGRIATVPQKRPDGATRPGKTGVSRARSSLTGTKPALEGTP